MKQNTSFDLIGFEIYRNNEYGKQYVLTPARLIFKCLKNNGSIILCVIILLWRYLHELWKHILSRKISNIRRTKPENLSDCRLVLKLPLANPLKSGVKLRMKMQLEQRRQAMLQLHLSNQQYYCQLMCDLY